MSVEWNEWGENKKRIATLIWNLPQKARNKMYFYIEFVQTMRAKQQKQQQ